MEHENHIKCKEFWQGLVSNHVRHIETFFQIQLIICASLYRYTYESMGQYSFLNIHVWFDKIQIT